MQNCITSFISYPFTHIKQIKKLTTKQLFLKDSPLYPAYAFFIVVSATSNIILSAWMVYFFINSDIHSCYSGVTLGIQILACIYPLYQVMMFLMLMVLISKAKYIAVKILIILCFTIILTSFGFGGLGVVFSCMVHQQDNTAIPNSFLIKNYFIQIIVYFMLIFILLYLILVPITVWLETRRDPNKERTGCELCIYFMNILFQMLLFIGFVVFLAIALGGVPVLFYLLNGINNTHPMAQQTFFGMAINSIVSPFVVFGIVYGIGKFFGLKRQQQMSISQKQNELTTVNSAKQTKIKQRPSIYNDGTSFRQRKTINLDDGSSISEKDTRREVLLESHQSKQFGEDEFMTKKKQSSKGKVSEKKV